MDLTFHKVLEDLTTDLKLVYYQEFPEVVKEINDINKTPKCLICGKKLLEAIMKLPDYSERLKLVYGEDVTITLIPNKKQLPNTQRIVRVPLSEWDTWVTSNSLQVTMRTIVTTFVDPTTNEVVVTSFSPSFGNNNQE